MLRKGSLVIFLTVLLFALNIPAASAHSSWNVDDNCDVGMSTSNPYFYADGPSLFWYIDKAAGANGCHLWTTTTISTTTPTNWANWYLKFSTTYSGDYYVDEYIVCDSHSTSTNVGYWRFRNGTDAGITEGYRKNQGPVCNAYMRITNPYDNFHGDKGGYMRMIDATGESSKTLTADLLKYIAKH